MRGDLGISKNCLKMPAEMAAEHHGDELGVLHHHELRLIPVKWYAVGCVPEVEKIREIESFSFCIGSSELRNLLLDLSASTDQYPLKPLNFFVQPSSNLPTLE